MAENLKKNYNEEIKYNTLTNTYGKDMFLICVSFLEIDKEYDLSKLQKKDMKIFQNFLNKICKMTIDQVDKSYKRLKDKNDSYNFNDKDHDVQHYGVNDKFRIHGVYINGMFHIIRIDPNHKVHNK